MNTRSNIVGWSMQNPDNVPSAHSETGLVDFGSVNVICGNNSAPAKSSASASAGSTVTTTWGSGDPNSVWPHTQGIIVNYMAACPNDDCTAASLTADQLSFFKIAEQRGQPPDNWAMAAIHASQKTQVKIPASLPAGAYVLRQELINFDMQWADEDWSATSVTDPSNLIKHRYYGAQIYPACINLMVKGGQGQGQAPQGKKGNELYQSTDRSFTINTYNRNEVANFPMPGPSVIPGGCSDVSGQPCDGSSGQPQPTGSPRMRFGKRRRGEELKGQ